MATMTQTQPKTAPKPAPMSAEEMAFWDLVEPYIVRIEQARAAKAVRLAAEQAAHQTTKAA